MAASALCAGPALGAAFDTLFPSHSLSAPTPVSTPSLGHVGEGESWDRPSSLGVGADERPTTPGSRRMALSAAKRFLGNVAVTIDDLSADGISSRNFLLKSKYSREVRKAFENLISSWPSDFDGDEDIVSNIE